MHPVTLYNPEKKSSGAGVDGTFEAVAFDCVVSVSHRRRAGVTRHPVEQGADISDHTKPEPAEIDLTEAIVSNFPALVAAPLRKKPNAAESAFGQLETWRAAGTPLTLVTDLDVYDQVVIEDFSVVRDARKANSMHATIRLVVIRTVETTSVKVPKAKKPRAASKVSKGAKNKEAAGEGSKEQGSALFKAFGTGTKLRGYLGLP